MRYFSTNMDSIRFWPKCEPVAVWDIQAGVNLLRFISGRSFSGYKNGAVAVLVVFCNSK